MKRLSPDGSTILGVRVTLDTVERIALLAERFEAERAARSGPRKPPKVRPSDITRVALGLGLEVLERRTPKGELV